MVRSTLPNIPESGTPSGAWCEALSSFSLGGAQNGSRTFQREFIFGQLVFTNLKEVQISNEAVKYYRLGA